MDPQAIHDRFLQAAEPFGPALAAAIARAGPQTLISRADLPFAEYLCRAIAGQQLSVKAARSIWTRVENSAGGAPLIEHFRPERAEILRACGLSGAKTKAIIAIAAEARAGGLEAESLRGLDHAGRSARLTAIWGVGQWTADMMSMFYFGEADIWPDGDVAARKTLQKLTSARRKTALTARRFAPHRSYLALYMWAHADAPPG
ncbi:MAG: DNA-3-methyladenine glycosylase 2 family protein [Maricaulaceae bacterium]|nr:DNA-3-methyladenine glycosylase 2 family protein [Maricaulaceae bacterium]